MLLPSGIEIAGDDLTVKGSRGEIPVEYVTKLTERCSVSPQWRSFGIGSALVRDRQGS